MKNIDDLAEEIFNKIKKDKSVRYSDLYNIKESEPKDIERAWNLLASEYKLIVSIKGVFSLSTSGKNFDSVESYLKSKKPKRFTLYQKVYLFLYGIFGLVGLLSWGYSEYSESNHNSLVEKHNSLMIDYKNVILKYDSLEVEIKRLQEKKLNDTSQTKIPDSLKTQ